MKDDIVQRKLDHLNSVLNRDVSHREGTGLEHIHFEHCALPELDFDQVDVRTEFLCRKLNAPLLVSSMTGGPEKARIINQTIAEIAQELRIAFAVGSQRIVGSCGPRLSGRKVCFRSSGAPGRYVECRGAASTGAMSDASLIREAYGELPTRAI